MVRLGNLFAVVMLSGIFSLLSAALFILLDAVDVALTEAAVGAGIATLLMLSTLAVTSKKEDVSRRRPWPALLIVLLTGGALVYATLDMPAVGDPEAPVHRHVAPRYIHDSPDEVGVPNLVTAVLASYRGYDTLGEVAVVFTAGIGVFMLLGARRRRPDEGRGED